MVKKVTLLGNEAPIAKAKTGLDIGMGELGTIGLKVSNGMIYEDIKTELSFPYSIVTYKQMSYDPIIAAGLSFYEYMMLKAKFRVKPVKDATEAELEQAFMIEECMNDMEHSWDDFIQEVSSMNSQGFSVHEIVLRPRLHSKGSLYNDGKVGWRKLPIRSQDTIQKWHYEDPSDPNKLTGLRQSTFTENRRATSLSRSGTFVDIPKNKFLLFRTGKRKDNPQGESILKSAYFPWKYRSAIEETEAVGIERDLSGLPVIYIPPEYMAEDATPEQKAIYRYYQNIVKNIQLNQQGGLVLPQAFHPESKQPMFAFKLMGAEGGKAYDTSAIIQRYDNKILTAMGCDILTMGQSSSGSYALGSIKSNMTAIAVESRLKEICNVINKQLIPITARKNGWDTSRLPQLSFDDLETFDLETWSKAMQRVASTGLVERDRPMLNKTREMLGVDPYPADEEVHTDLLTGATSKSGQGLETPFEGTRTQDGGGDDNSSNSENVG